MNNPENSSKLHKIKRKDKEKKKKPANFPSLILTFNPSSLEMHMKQK